MFRFRLRTLMILLAAAMAILVCLWLYAGPISPVVTAVAFPVSFTNEREYCEMAAWIIHSIVIATIWTAAGCIAVLFWMTVGRSPKHSN
jgi:hypothetical protein